MNPKIVDFQMAMQKYQENPWYQHLGKIVAMAIVGLQGCTSLDLIYAYDGSSVIRILISLFCAYIATDFINGCVHMYMDNNQHYTSVFGPLIAAFHLHHGRLQYVTRHPLHIYFLESGTKLWLLVYLSLLCYAQYHLHLNYLWEWFWVGIGVFSSLAEVSHYWCHNATKANTVIYFLQRSRILLSKKHHIAHHQADNTQYAFLNGVTNPFLNWIARRCYRGYKMHADQHVAAYMKRTGQLVSEPSVPHTR